MHDLTDRLLELAIQIQQIPAPTFEEGQRAEFVLERFKAEGLAEVSRDAIGNVYGRWISNGTGPPLVVSAHTDTVFSRDADLRVRREAERVYAPGLGDNSLGVAALIGLVWKLRAEQTQLPGDLWLAANVGEEGLGDLRGMRAVVDRFGRDVRGYLILEGLALGHVYHRAVGVQRYRVTLRTAGGHSWSDYGRPSAVHALADLVTQLTVLRLPTRPRTTLNVGTITGGTTVNTLAAEASFELDLRSEGKEELAGLVREAESLIDGAGREGVAVQKEITSRRPPGEIAVDHPLIKLAVACVRAQGLEATLTGGSTDANLPLSLGLPALVLGVTTGGGAHTQGEYVDIAPIEKGMRQLMDFVTRAE